MIFDPPELFKQKIYSRAFEDNYTWDHKLNADRDANFARETICNHNYIFGKNVVTGHEGDWLSGHSVNTYRLVIWCLERGLTSVIINSSREKVVNISKKEEIPEDINEYYLKQVEIDLQPTKIHLDLLKYIDHL